MREAGVMDISQHFKCEVYSAHVWEHGSFTLRQVRKRKREAMANPLAYECLVKGKRPLPPCEERTPEMTAHLVWDEHVCVQYATTPYGRKEMNLSHDSVECVKELFGNTRLVAAEPVSWIVYDNVFVIDIFMSYTRIKHQGMLNDMKHVRLYIDRGYGDKAIGWENWDDTLTKVEIDKQGNVCLITLEDKLRRREEDGECLLGDDSDFSEDEDGRAIPKRTRKVMDKYRVKRTVILSPQEFATALLNEHEDLSFFWLEMRKKLQRKRRIGLLTLCKMLIKIRRLRFDAIGRKWAPGGSEYIKHLNCETAKSMLRVHSTSLVECV